MLEEDIIARIEYLQQETHYKSDNYTLMKQAIKELMPNGYYADTARIFDITINEAKIDFERNILAKII